MYRQKQNGIAYGYKLYEGLIKVIRQNWLITIGCEKLNSKDIYSIILPIICSESYNKIFFCEVQSNGLVNNLNAKS